MARVRYSATVVPSGEYPGFIRPLSGENSRKTDHSGHPWRD